MLEVYGLRPWEMERLTVEEWNTIVKREDEKRKEQRKKG